MLIRDIDRSPPPRVRAKGKDADANPLRKTAEGLGLFLDRLSETVRESRTAQSDTVDSGIKAHSHSPMRNFKWPTHDEEALPAIQLNLTEEQGETLNMLREARNLASDTSAPIMQRNERAAAQERLQELFFEINSKRIDILTSMMGGEEKSDTPIFSLLTPETARTAYTAIDDMITRFLDIETRDTANGADNAQSEHEAALLASEQLKEFLIDVGPAKAFSRFREINRNNVLGLIQQ